MLAVVGLVASAGPAFGTQSPLKNVTWTEGNPSPFAGTRLDGQYDKANKRIYVLGYRLVDGSTNGEVWYYDVASKTYVDTGVAMPVPVSNYEIAALTDPTGLGFYVFGGRDSLGSLITTVQVYYPGTNTTAVISSDPWPGTTPSSCVSLPANAVATVGNNAYVLGGLAFAANGCLDENSSQTWRFNPMGGDGSKWSQGPDLNMARGYITTAVVGKKIYAIGGDTNVAGAPTPQSIVESWSPGDGSWNDAGVADLPQVCDESQAFGFKRYQLKNTITLAGCGQWPNATGDVLQYDVVGNSWSLIGTLNEARRNQAGAVIGSVRKPKLVVLGGYDATGATVLTSIEFGKPSAQPIVPRLPHRSTGGSGRGVSAA